MADFVEIGNVCVRKAIIEATKRIINSDKVCHSYNDLNFGVTFLEHSVRYEVSEMLEMDGTGCERPIQHALRSVPAPPPFASRSTPPSPPQFLARFAYITWRKQASRASVSEK